MKRISPKPSALIAALSTLALAAQQVFALDFHYCEFEPSKFT
jgi:hypothetical protein